MKALSTRLRSAARRRWLGAVAGLLWLAAGAARGDSGAAAADISLAGTWKGTLSGALRLVATISRSADGTYHGILDSVDQGATIPIDGVTVVGGKVRMEVRQVAGTYEGTLSRDGTEVRGIWTQGGQSVPLSFVKQKPGADGGVAVARAPNGLKRGPPGGPRG